MKKRIGTVAVKGAGGYSGGRSGVSGRQNEVHTGTDGEISESGNADCQCGTGG